VRIEVVLNANARRGSGSTARALERTLPFAVVHRTDDLAAVKRVAKRLVANPPDLVLAAGGDGTSLALLNAVRQARRELGPTGSGATHKATLLRLGLLKLGTGNGWARSSGAPRLGRGLERLASFASRAGSARALPLTRYDLLEVDGVLAHFAGTGWDAELIDDFHTQRNAASVLPPPLRNGLLGYLNGLMTLAVPRNLRLPRVEVEIKNSGAHALGIDARGRSFEFESGEKGAVLYRGPVSVCGAGTSTQWGFGFRAFPFARLVPGRFNLRMYVGTTKEALARVPLLWSGRHPLPKMLTWLLSRCDATFSRPVPLQAGGDLLGQRDRAEYSISGETVDVLDWRALGRLVGAPERLLKDAVVGQLEPSLSRSGILV
jgi:diacylglycerol kinase family enzyme